ncbi:MAG: YraN family protein, partial [Verrucomicrobiae bacterium]|nr:YraN family protein [Verrucomicrobiae bacterium]
MPWKWLRPLARQPTAQIDRGERGEEAAARYLRRVGYKILVRRFKSRYGEIDLVCRQGEWLVFVEVKTRADEQFGAPSEAVNR